MANLGYVSTFNINGNELTLKDAALTEIVSEIIEAIGANNTNIAERINDLHNRSFDNTIKISSQNESEIASIQDGLYKIQYVTVAGEGDNATETLNNSAILIQKETNQYLYKDGQLSSRTKTDSTWGSWINIDRDHPIKEFISNTDNNQIEGTLHDESDGYYLISWTWNANGNTRTWGPELLRKDNDIIHTLADNNNELFDYDYDNNVYNIINFDNLEIKNANTETTYDAPSLLSPLPASIKSMYDMLQNLGLIQVSETYDEETEKTTYSISLPSDNIEHPIVLAVKDYENYSEEDQQQDNPNYGLYESLMNLDFVKPVGDATYVMPDWIGTVGKTEIAYMFGLIPHEQYESNIYPDRIICDVGLIEVKTVSKQSNFMYQYDYNVEVTEYLLLERKKRTINYLWINTGGINAFDFRNVEWTDYDYFLKNVNYPVTSVNGQTGAVSLSIPDAQIQADWNQTTTTAADYIKNKPTIPAAQIQADWNQTTTTAADYIKNKPTIKDELSSNYATSTDTNDDLLLSSGDTYEEAFGKIEKAILDNELVTSTAVNDLNTRINNLGTLATVATSGDYNDLTNRPASIVNSVNGQTGTVTLTIPDAVTESTVAGWGFTKNTGTLTTETQLSKGTATGTGNAVTDINVSNHQITLVKGKTFLETAPVTSVNGQTGAVTLALGDTNVIETVKVNNTALTPVSKAVNITVPTKTSDLTNDSGFLTQAPVTSVNNKTGAVTVKENVQSDWNATTGDAVILNKPTIPTVNDSTVTITMNGNTVGTFTLNKSGNTTIDLGTVLTSHQSIKTINNQTITGTGNVNISGLPAVTSADNGKVLMVVNGAWQLVSPVSLYSGSSAPSNSQGNNGDIYVQS